MTNKINLFKQTSTCTKAQLQFTWFTNNDKHKLNLNLDWTPNFTIYNTKLYKITYYIISSFRILRTQKTFKIKPKKKKQEILHNLYIIISQYDNVNAHRIACQFWLS